VKRYVILNLQFDTRATILGSPIKEEWDAVVKETHHKNRGAVISSLAQQYGTANLDPKLANLLDLGPLPMSILAFHNRFLPQVRDAFVMGAYYPSLTGAFALAERILAHLVIRLREHYRTTPQYKYIYKKSSFSDWNEPIDVLEAWRVLLPDAVVKLRQLKDLRWRAIHFDPALDHDDRTPALEAIHLLSDVIALQFSVTDRDGRFTPRPWFIPNTPGFRVIRKESENNPFIAEIFLPNCGYAGPYFRIGRDADGWPIVVEENEYDSRDVTDDDWAAMCRSHQSGAAVPPSRTA